MDATSRRRESIARELAAWTADLPRLMRHSDNVMVLPHITDSQAFDAESIVEPIGLLLKSIQASINSGENNERLSAFANCLREKIAAADATLDRLVRAG
jgi:hypothetical protein